MARIAIVTRTKDRTEMLRRCVKSVSAQAFGDYVQVIVNDGGSREDVENVVAGESDAARRKIVVVLNAAPTGRWPPANIGVRAVDSELVTLLDDDDTLDPTFLARMTAAYDARRYANTGGVACRTRIINEKIADAGLQYLGEREFNPDFTEALLFVLAAKNKFTVNAFLYARSCYDALGGYRDDLPVLGDWDFNIRFLLQFDIEVVPATLANWHIRAELGGTQSITSEASRHASITNQLRNALLRADVNAGRVGLGYINAVSLAIKMQRADYLRTTRILGPFNKAMSFLRSW